jgi:hypothetical protein
VQYDHKKKDAAASMGMYLYVEGEEGGDWGKRRTRFVLYKAE